MKEDGGFRIKFKHYASSIVFDTRVLDLFLADCGMVNGFFEKNISRLKLKVHKRRSDLAREDAEKKKQSSECECGSEDENGEVLKADTVSRSNKKRKRFSYAKEIWDPIRDNMSVALTQDISSIVVFTETSRVVYNELIEILTSACLDPEILNARTGDVIINRVIRYQAETLQALGEKHGVTRERIRQICEKGWRRFSRIIARYDTVYTARIVALFSRLSYTEAVGAIAYISYKNQLLGEWLTGIVARGDDRDGLRLTLQKLK